MPTVVDQPIAAMPNTNCQSPNLMTVADAAVALSVSRSTVYRFDRENGPFKIIKQGRRVLIDRCTFSQYLSARSVKTVDAISEEPRGTEEPEPPDNREREEPPATDRAEPPRNRERTGCGQRELVMPVRWPMGVSYIY
jgi:excisionase family DNA binding protein